MESTINVPDILEESDPTYNGSITPDEIQLNENSTVKDYTMPQLSNSKFSTEDLGILPRNHIDQNDD
jgi:hypothetical protein